MLLFTVTPHRIQQQLEIEDLAKIKMTCYTLNGNRNRNLHNKEYRQMVVEKKGITARNIYPTKQVMQRKKKTQVFPAVR